MSMLAGSETGFIPEKCSQLSRPLLITIQSPNRQLLHPSLGRGLSCWDKESQAITERESFLLCHVQCSCFPNGNIEVETNISMKLSFDKCWEKRAKISCCCLLKLPFCQNKACADLLQRERRVIHELTTWWQYEQVSTNIVSSSHHLMQMHHFCRHALPPHSFIHIMENNSSTRRVFTFLTKYYNIIKGVACKSGQRYVRLTEMVLNFL